MLEMAWSEPASVPLLQYLVKGPLKQNLAQAVRLWGWLHFLYGSRAYRLVLPEPFTYAHCREGLFTASHPSADEKPTLHDVHCPCAKTLAAWLFSPQVSWTQAQWLSYRMQAAGEVGPLQQQWLHELRTAEATAENIEQLLEQARPFAVTRRTLASDLKRLRSLGWLKAVEQGYGRVTRWPQHPTATASVALPFIMQPDLADIAANLSQEIGGQQRFFVHTDYVVPQDGHDRVEDWQDALRGYWSAATIPPLWLNYWSASRLAYCNSVVYPVCLYYYRRGPYLCGWGQVDGQVDKLGVVMDWRNYRLDRIKALTALSWESEAVPAALKLKRKRGELPQPEEIERRMAQAWGFDYYQPIKQLLVRFDAEWDERYIRKSLRHETFEQVGYDGACKLVMESLWGEERENVLAVLGKRLKTDAYYIADYRHDDPNVRQRLRAWRPHIEVLLPWTLRQRFAAEVARESRLYE